MTIAPSMDKNIDRELAAKQSIALAKMAKILKMPVVITSSQEDHAQGPILPEIARIQPEARVTHELCDEHGDLATASVLENWIDEAENRVWFLFETIRRA